MISGGYLPLMWRGASADPAGPRSIGDADEDASASPGVDTVVGGRDLGEGEYGS